MGIIRRDLYTLEQNTIALIFNCLSHPGRLKILLLLLVNDSLTLGQIQQQLGLSQSAVSDQVRFLKNTGLIVGKEVGTSVHYSIDKNVWTEVRGLNGIFWQEVENL